MFGLGHMDMMPLFAGIIYSLGILSLINKWRRAQYFGLGTELFIFVVLMRMHGGTLSGGIGATIAALIVGSFVSRPKNRSKT